MRVIGIVPIDTRDFDTEEHLYRNLDPNPSSMRGPGKMSLPLIRGSSGSSHPPQPVAAGVAFLLEGNPHLEAAF